MIEVHSPRYPRRSQCKGGNADATGQQYVVPLRALEDLAPLLDDHFDVLDINGKRKFGYRTQYFDTPT